MRIHSTQSDDWLTAAYLLEDGDGTGVLVDANGVGEPLLELARERGLQLAALLLTHHHVDHVMLEPYRDCRLPVYGHPLTAELLGDVDHQLEDGELLRFGGLSIEALHPRARQWPPVVSGQRR